MNKLLKGAIAGAAGVALLLGGAGTFAMWNDTASVDGGTIVAGNLVVADDLTAGIWKSGVTPITLSGYEVVPGDVLTYSKTMKVSATGDNLVATLALASGAISPSSSDAADSALAGYLTKTAVLTVDGATITGAGPTFTVKEGAGIATVTVTITFPKHGTAGAENSTMDGSVVLDGLAVTLTQN